MSDHTPVLSGRLGRPDLTLRDDPRADPRMVAAAAPIGLADPTPEMPMRADAPLDALLQFAMASEEAFGSLFTVLNPDVPAVTGVERSVEVIKGVDGNDITLFVHRPSGAKGPLPGVLHLHGGGMVLLTAADGNYQHWRDSLAATGLVVVGVEFRNAGGKLGPHAFPAGLNDCSSALRWLADNRARLGVGKIIVSGESGGGNLTLATTLKAKRDGVLHLIDGVYAQCPYISNTYGSPDPTLVSLVENDGYFLSCDQMTLLARVYDPTGEHDRNPLAWPYHAPVEELRGLPPHVISVNQLDPLRDEGLAYYRKLLEAGVSAVGRTVNGTCHAGDCIFVAAMPDVFAATVRDIKGFADSL
jgi:acetyl esterase/lipase